MWTHGRRCRWASARVVLVLAIGSGSLQFEQNAEAAGQRLTEVVRIIDGDTFVLEDGVRIRVRNFDTPELRRSKCPEERELAIAARHAAAGLLKGRSVTVIFAYRDRYERWVADLLIHDGYATRDFVAAMVESGHGARWAYGKEPKPQWCSAGGI